MKKTLMWIALIILVLFGVVYFYNQSLEKGAQYKNKGDNYGTNYMSENEDINQSTNTVSDSNSSTTYTVADVFNHNVATDCWSTISDKVYDLTSYVYKHPGGPEQILVICGKDGTSLFGGQHGGNGKIERMLLNFYKGNLAK